MCRPECNLNYQHPNATSIIKLKTIKWASTIKTDVNPQNMNIA